MMGMFGLHVCCTVTAAMNATNIHDMVGAALQVVADALCDDCAMLVVQ
jgi:hypothetical protein